MIFADKMIALRKQNGWSQEEVAAKMGVSRQSVSKWESGMSIPDLDKIIKLSQLFSVSTDYLLKDELEVVESENYDMDSGTKTCVISLEEANTYMNEVEKRASKLGLGVLLLICSPIPLLLLGVMAENKNISENMAGGMGVSALLILVAIGVSILIFSGMTLNQYEFLEKENFDLMYGVEGIVEKRKKEFEKTYQTSIIIGVVLCITCVVPLMLAVSFDASDSIMVICVCALLFIISIAVYVFVRFGSIHSSYEKLLQSGDYTQENKSINKKTAFFAPFYWTLITAIYLGISFTMNNWKISWVIWPVAGVLFVALNSLIKFMVNRK